MQLIVQSEDFKVTTLEQLLKDSGKTLEVITELTDELEQEILSCKDSHISSEVNLSMFKYLNFFEFENNGYDSRSYGGIEILRNTKGEILDVAEYCEDATVSHLQSNFIKGYEQKHSVTIYIKVI